MTHLTTLNVLRNYFIRNQVVRNLRLIDIIAMMILLAFDLVLPLDEICSSAPFQCAFPPSAESVLYHNAIYLESTIGTLRFLFRSYARRIEHLFNDQHSEDQLPYSNRERFLRIILRCQHRELDIDANMYRKIVEEVISGLRTIKKEKRLRRPTSPQLFTDLAYSAYKATPCPFFLSYQRFSSV